MADSGFKNMYPELFTPESIKRKGEIVLELLVHSKKLQDHTISCVIEKEEYSDDCEICDNVSAFANATLFIEKEINRKIDVKDFVQFFESIFDEIINGV